MKILLAYATTHGSTAGIATRIAGRLREHGAEVLPAEIRTLPRRFDVGKFDAVIVGGRVWGNRYPWRLVRFVRHNLDALRARPSAFFSVCVWHVSRIDGHRAEAREVPRRFLASTGWAPELVEVIAGTLAFTKYGFGLPFLGRRLMLAIWRGDVGDLDTTRDHVFTDWAQVDAFAESFWRLVQPRRVKSAEPAAHA